MKSPVTWQQLFYLIFGIMGVALVLYNLDPLQLSLQEQAAGTSSQVQKQRNFDPFFVKGFKQLDGQYFIVIVDGVVPEDCPCSDLKVRRGKNPSCPVVHHREKKAIIAKGRKLGLPEYNFPVLEVCD